MLALQIHAPFDLFVLEFDAVLHRFLQDFDTFGVFHLGEGLGEDGVEFVHGPGSDHLLEEFHFVGALLEDVVDAELDALFHQDHIVIEVGKGDLGFDHPELGSVTGGVALLGAEGRAEGIDIAESEGKRLDVELAGDGQRSLAAIEVGLGRLALVVESGDGKGLSGAFGIVSGDLGRMDVDEAAALKEFVDA